MKSSTAWSGGALADARRRSSPLQQPVVQRNLPGDEQRNVPLFTHRWPTAGRHTIEIVVRPDANPWATWHTIHLDNLYTMP